jgi:hypothetical protein
MIEDIKVVSKANSKADNKVARISILPLACMTRGRQLS